MHNCVKNYRDSLVKANEFHKLNEDLELWIQQKTEIINRMYITKTEFRDLKEIEFILTQINQNLEDLKQNYNNKVKHLSELAIKVYGEHDGPNKVKHVVTKNVDLINNCIQLKEDVEKIKVNFTVEQEKSKVKSSQIYHESPAIEPDVAPDFKRKLESAIVLSGSKHSFECVAEGSLPLEILWFKNGVELETTDLYLTSFDEKSGQITLFIKNATANDNALFSCRITNELGMAETSAFLKVKDLVKPQGSAPLVVTPLESVQLNADSNYTLECIISGEPEPTCTWFKDNIEIDLLPENIRSGFRVSKFMNVRQLTILNTDSDLHTGTYTCKAKNEYGEADCSCGILIRSMFII